MFDVVIKACSFPFVFSTGCINCNKDKDINYTDFELSFGPKRGNTVQACLCPDLSTMKHCTSLSLP